MKKIILKLIKLYQKSFSPDHGWAKEAFPFGFCRFTPTCSEYSYEAVERFGVIKGLSLGFWRIIRCNPFSKGGTDKLSENLNKKQFWLGFIFLSFYLFLIVSLIILIIKIYTKGAV